MSAELISAAAGLVGALIGGGCTLLAVQIGEIQKRKSHLLMLLISQRAKLRSGKIRSLEDLTAEEHLAVVQAFYGLRASLLLSELRAPFDAEWRIYKAGNDDFLPLFRRFETTQLSQTSFETVSHHLDYLESTKRLDRFVRFLSERVL